MDTREAIRTTFMTVYAREPLDRITVKALCAAVPIARTTFYAHYRNVDDVLNDVEESLLAGLAEVTDRVSKGDLRSMDFVRFLDETLDYIQANWSDFRAFLITQSNVRFEARWKDAIKTNFARRYPQVCMQQNWELLAEMGASATLGAYAWWMEHPNVSGRETAENQIERAITAIVESFYSSANN